MATSTTTTFSIPIMLSGIGGAANGVTKPALRRRQRRSLYGFQSNHAGGHQRRGQLEDNGMLTISGQITGPGRVGGGEFGAGADEPVGAVTIAGAISNDYTGGTTINRGTVYLQKTGGAIAIPGNLTINAGGSSLPLWNTYVALQASNQIAPTAVISFTGKRSALITSNCWGTIRRWAESATALTTGSSRTPSSRRALPIWPR